MICEVNIENIDYIINLVKNRQINYLVIKKQNNKFYTEYRDGENNNDNLIELLSELENFKESLSTNSVMNLYLYYDSELDKLITNYQKIDNNDNIINTINRLKTIKSDINFIKDEKIILTEGKKKMNISYEKIINNLITNLIDKI